MEIKEVILAEEKERVISFLAGFDLALDSDVDTTFYIEENAEIIGTISKSGHIIKDVAVADSFQDENLTGMLVSKMLEKMSSEQIYDYQVFTKPANEQFFTSLGFHKLIRTDRVIMLEGGAPSISATLERLKKIIEISFSSIDATSDIGCVVINGNPLTIGHQYLIEQVSLRHKIALVFVVEEDRSEFSFLERLSMAYLSSKSMNNVLVLPSTKYVVSQLTFPAYFLRDSGEVNEETAKVDALVFQEYFMKYLFIKKRYVGTESSLMMQHYNDLLKQILDDKLEIIPRLDFDGETVSASKVRQLLKEKKLDEALKYVPREITSILSTIAKDRYGC